MTRATVTLSDAIDQYLAYLAAKRLETNTIKNSTYLLRKALAVWGNVHVTNLQPRHVDRLFAENRWGPRTHNTNLQIIKTFFAWCRNQGYMPLNADPCFGWRNQRVPQQEKLRVPVERFNELLDAAEHPRDRVIVACGLFLFLRGSEIAHLRVGDVDFKNSTVRIWRQKTKQEDVLPMSIELAAELRPWLNYYRAEQGTLRDDWFLCPARLKNPWVNSGGNLVPSGLPQRLNPTKPLTHTYRPAKEALAKLGYPTLGEGEHTLRRSGARAYADVLRERGYDGVLLRVASMLGHSDVKVTQTYIGWALEKEQRNIELAGKPMFPNGLAKQGQVLRIVEAGA